MEERLQKILSRYGIASRRQAEKLILEGRITINGTLARLGDTADDEQDQITVDGVCLQKEPKRLYIVLNKPRGYVTTLHDERGRKHVSQLVAECGQRVYPVGRLDMYSEGLLLLTNDGQLANGLMHPGHEVTKTYLVWVSDFHPDKVQTLRSPMVIDGQKLQPAKVSVCNQNGTVALLQFTIHEGKNRQIRKMCQQVGYTVTRLKRIAEGPIQLGTLPVGAWRELTKEEVKALQKATQGPPVTFCPCKKNDN